MTIPSHNQESNNSRIRQFPSQTHLWDRHTNVYFEREKFKSNQTFHTALVLRFMLTMPYTPPGLFTFIRLYQNARSNPFDRHFRQTTASILSCTTVILLSTRSTPSTELLLVDWYCWYTYPKYPSVLVHNRTLTTIYAASPCPSLRYCCCCVRIVEYSRHRLRLHHHHLHLLHNFQPLNNSIASRRCHRLKAVL